MILESFRATSLSQERVEGEGGGGGVERAGRIATLLTLLTAWRIFVANTTFAAKASRSVNTNSTRFATPGYSVTFIDVLNDKTHKKFRIWRRTTLGVALCSHQPRDCNSTLIKRLTHFTMPSLVPPRALTSVVENTVDASPVVFATTKNENV